MTGNSMTSATFKKNINAFGFVLNSFLYSVFIMLCVPVAHAAEVLTVGVVKDSKPMSWHNNKGELVGFNIDVAQALCAALKATCRIREAPLSELIEAVAENRIDFIAASLLETEERAKKMFFTVPYYRSTSYLIGKRGTTLKTAGLKIAVQAGSRQQEYLKSIASSSAVVIAFPTLVNIGEGLANGTATSALLPMPMAIGLMEDPKLIAENYTVIQVEIPELMGGAKIGVTRAKPVLRDRLDAAIKAIRADGKLEKINSKHLPFRVI